ncbi:MAG: asparagine synthase (glutamine-hydrolyzing) [Ferruginibacter sp.]|nr:asparagine synthase (glutamine-hydrolyzing) [Cytophagales bacterium]
MCRIAGIVGNFPSPDEKRTLVRGMADCMAHGGPDDEGLWEDRAACWCFGHRRLSILDLTSAGHQPMSTPDGTIWITFNGEIYNFRALRAELRALGCSFRTQTDTEVLLWAYHAWGEESFSRLNGIFAFALFDARRQVVLLVRDASGIKPLYYAVHHQSLVFASEVKAFKMTGLSFPEDPDWKIHFLTFGFLPQERTTLQSVSALPKGHYLTWDIPTGKFTVHPHTRFHFSSEVVDREESLRLIREQLAQAVERQLISDAPIGVFLSGGVDSSLLALLAEQTQGENLRTLSVTFSEDQYSEQKFQQAVVERLRGTHTYYVVTQSDFIEHLPRIFGAMDQPSVDGINTWFISKCAREAGLKAVLSGLGADELLGGYPSFARIDTLENLCRLPGRVFSAGELFRDEKLKKLSFLQLGNDLGRYLFLRGMFTPRRVARFLDATEGEVKNKLRSMGLGDALNGLAPGNKASWLELNIYMQSQLLKDTDYMGMSHGLEVRVPFLDQEFVRSVMRIDPGVKFIRHQPKELLKSAFRDLLPESVWKRPKMGFTFPFQQWIKQTDAFRKLMHHPNQAVREIAQSFGRGETHWSRCWSLIVMDTWGKNG